MVKKNTAAAQPAAKGPKIIRGSAKKVPAKKAGNLSREALADDDKKPMTSEQASQPDKAPAGGWSQPEPKEGDRRHDDASGMDVVFHDGRWVPAAGQAWGGGGVDDDAGTADEGIAGDQRDDPDAPAEEQGVLWGTGLDGQQRIVDEEGEDASEAGKVKKSRAKKAAPKSKNSDDDRGVNLTGMTKDLIDIVQRVERLAEEKAVISDDIKEVMAEAKQKGYSTPIIREAIRRRAMDPEKRKEHDALISLYEEALRGL